MGTCGFRQIENIKKMEPIKKKLKVTDYIFTYQNKDLMDAYITYYFDSVKYVDYKDGKKREEKVSPLIELEISAKDEYFNTFSFSFMVEISIEQLNKLSSNPNNINDKIIESEIFFENPYKETIGPVDANFRESIYQDTANFFVAKEGENRFIFKASVPSESVFLWFNLDFCNTKKEE